MLKALRYLKPYWLSVLAVIALTYAQVQCNLALPDYMSNIITEGIQYGGITEAVPSALRSSTMEHLAYFMDEEEYESFSNYYEKIEQGNTSYLEIYPDLEKEDVYILKDGTSPDSIAEPLLITEMLESDTILEQFGLSNSDELYTLLKMNPEMASNIILQAEEKLSSYTEDNLEAAGIMAVKEEYTALGMDTEKIQNDYIWSQGLFMLAIAALGSLCAILGSYLSARVATGASRDLRDDVFKKVESFSSEEFSKFSTASLITRTTNDIQQVQQILTMLLRMVLFAPIMGVTALFKVMRYPSMLGILGWVVAAIAVLLVSAFMITLPKFKKIQKLVDDLNLVTREQLEGMLVIRAFNNQKYEENRFDSVNKEITNVNIFVNRMMSTMMPIMTFIMSGVSLLIIWFGGALVDAGTMPIGDMMAFMQYAMEVLMSFMIVAMIFIMIPRSSVSANRIFEVLETEPTILDPKVPKELPKENQTITFDHVCFKYPKAEENVLNDITFEAKPGETIAFIGSTGSGKSTLINLLPRFFDVTEGSIKFGDVDIRDVKQHDLRNRIGYIPQKGILFSGTIESNLKYADKNANEETIENALEVSQAKEFVSKMPNGIQEPIAQGGTNVSGGQKQRLSIARALTKKADIFIFDDTFSALDYATDAKLREALRKMTEKTKATVFIVAQRISTIKNADKIIVLDNGSIVGIGQHDDLMKNCSVYQEIAYSQLSKEELGQ